MAGLLDFYSDPQANMALAAGLLSGGNFGQAMGRGGFALGHGLGRQHRLV